MNTVITGQTVSTRRISVPSEYDRASSLIEDDALRMSIEQSGIEQPLVLLPDGDGFTLVDGLRRFRIAQMLGLPEVPAVIDEVPAGTDAADYRRRLRFLLDEHRQDLLPSQRAVLVKEMKRLFGLTDVQLGKRLGVDDRTVRNWMAVDACIPAIREMVDAGTINVGQMRAFTSLNEEGQKRALSRHRHDLHTVADLHATIRQEFPPEELPELYRDAKRAAIKITPQKRKGKKRAVFTAADKERLAQSLKLREIEVRDGKAELKTLKAQCMAASPIVAAVLRNEDVRALVPAEMLGELERFSEVY